MTFPSLLRRPLAALAMLGLSALLILPAQAEVVFQDITSSAGIHAWLVEDYAVPIVTIRFAFEGGTTQDPVGKEGLTTLMTTLFDEGAGTLDSDAFQIALDDAGAEMGFAADADATYGSMRMLADQRDEAVALLKLAIEKPSFSQNPIDRMRAQLITGINASAQDPNTAAQRQWGTALYGDHPYSRRSQGTPETLNTLDGDDLRAQHQAIFARGKLSVGIVGAISADDAKAMLDTLFANLPAEPKLAPIADIKPNLGQDLRVDYKLPQTSIFMAFPSVARTDPDYFAAYIMAQILGGDTFQSRLTSEVREKRGLTYGISASMVGFEHSQSLLIATATRAESAPETLKVIQDVIAGLVADGPTETELANAKRYIIGSYPISELSSSSAIANTLVGLQMRDLGIDYISTRADQINAVTVDDIRAIAARLLTVKPTIMQMGPAQGPEGPVATQRH